MASGGMDLSAGGSGFELGPGSFDDQSEYTIASFHKQTGKVALLPATGRVFGASGRHPKDLSSSLAVKLCQPWVTTKLTKCLTVKGADEEREKAHHELYMGNNKSCCFGDDPNVWPNVCPRLTDEQRRKAEEKYKGFKVAVHQFTTVKLVPVGDVKGPAPIAVPTTFDSPGAVSGGTGAGPPHVPRESRGSPGTGGESLVGVNALEVRAIPKTRGLHAVYKVGPPVGYRGGVRTTVPRWAVGLAATLLVLGLTAMLHMRRLQLERDLAEKGSAYEQAHFIDGGAVAPSTMRSIAGHSSRRSTDSASSSYPSSPTNSARSINAYNSNTRQSSAVAGLVPPLSGGPFEQEVPARASPIAGLIPDAEEEQDLSDLDPLDALLSPPVINNMGGSS
ncbi:hypothetical protein FOL46_005909 [Perkinsus olseni]|uniref:Uncharacterized protein n=2 Tax=Perkinsus olseni TaxID=32597 RepID=A0A7J6MR20_PEROL|nr:hypothetical protein FOL46_005909 [Perkinsus olseni]